MRWNCSTRRVVRIHLVSVGAAAGVVAGGGPCMGRERETAVLPRHRDARAAVGRRASPDPGRVDRPSADAPGREAIPGAQPHPGRGPGAVRRGRGLGDPVAQLHRGRGADDCGHGYVVGVGFHLCCTRVALEISSWHGTPVNRTVHPTLAGLWWGCASWPAAIPIHCSCALGIFRLFIWARFLWHVSRIDLSLIPTHPDRCGGLSFLASISQARSGAGPPRAGCAPGGGDGQPDFFRGREVDRLQAGDPRAGHGDALLRRPRASRCSASSSRNSPPRSVGGLREYGVLAQRYVREFEALTKWLPRRRSPPDEPLLGSADIQSLADLGNSYSVINDMRLMPFTFQEPYCSNSCRDHCACCRSHRCC